MSCPSGDFPEIPLEGTHGTFPVINLQRVDRPWVVVSPHGVFVRVEVSLLPSVPVTTLSVIEAGWDFMSFPSSYSSSCLILTGS